MRPEDRNKASRGEIISTTKRKDDTGNTFMFWKQFV